MNEITKKIIDQAKRECVIPGAFTADEYLNKTVELTVKECIDICEKYAESVLKYSQFSAQGAKDCVELIKNKLGVE